MISYITKEKTMHKVEYHLVKITQEGDTPHWDMVSEYTELKPALDNLVKLTCPNYSYLLRIEPVEVDWSKIDGKWEKETTLKYDFEGNDDIFISNYVEGWEDFVKKLGENND
jgi:hypothetical protein